MEIYLDDLEKETLYDLSEDLIYIEDIDQGAFGKVIHVKEKSTQRDISVKIIDKSQADQNLIKKMKEEISILKKLDHENIVKFYGQIETSNQLLIKMEYIKYGTLSHWMKKNKKISEEDASLILKQVLSAIDYLHSNQICHRDIKPENIMISKENDLNSIKIIDFGLSSQNFDSLSNSDYCGTFIYMAPEEIERKSYYLSVDIWSIGILMYMLLNKGEHPFYHKGDTKEDFINNLKSIKELKCNNKISYMAMNLLKKLLEPDPLKRYKATDALKHPWITRNVEDKIPQTFNDQITNDNIINNAKELMMISIFLNYFKKNSILCKRKIYYKNSSVEQIIDKLEFKIRKKKKGIYIISDDYIKKCEFISRVEKERLKELKEKCLDVSSTEEESDEKNNNNSNFINSNMNSNSNINSNISNSNIFSIKHCNTNKDKNKYRIFSEISNTSKEKPILLIAPKNTNNKNNKNYIEYTENKRSSLKIKPPKSLFLNSMKNEKNMNYTYRSSSKKRQNSNIPRSITKININNNNINNINVFNYLNRNIKNIKPVNLFLNNNNNSQNKSKINETKINIVNIPLEKNSDKIKNNTKSNNFLTPIKLPKIDFKISPHIKKVKSKKRLLIV